MILVTEITNRSEREAAWDFLADNQCSAAQIASSFDGGSKVRIGPVAQRGSGASFDLLGVRDGVLLPMSVTIPNGMPEGCVWNDWRWELQEAGLRVKCNAAYDAILDAASEREDEGVTLY